MRNDMGASLRETGSRERSPAVSALSGFDPARRPWCEDYIDGAASMVCKIYRPDGSLFCDQSSNYETPDNGIHLCGQHDDGQQPTTVATYEMSGDEAAYAFQLAKEVAECGKDEADFVVDLCVDSSIIDDFWSNRQIWPLAIRAWNTAIAIEAAEPLRREAGSTRKGESAGRQASPKPSQGGRNAG